MTFFKSSRAARFYLLVFLCSVCIALCLMFLSSCAAENSNPASDTTQSSVRVITDMRNKEITIPKDPKRVAIIDKGTVLQTMVSLGVQDRIIAEGGILNNKTDKCERDSALLYPAIKTVPFLGYPTSAIDFESLINANPDLIIMRNSEYIKDNEITKKAINTIEEELHIPLVVLQGPGCFDKPEIEKQLEGIQLIGKIFNKEEQAKALIKTVKSEVAEIQKRTSNINEADKPKVLFMGLIKDKGVGSVWGDNNGDAKFAREYANIKNAYDVSSRARMSAEQIIALNPEVIVLGTSSITPNPSILKTDPHYADLSEIPAVKNNRIASLGKLTWWGDFRLEFPVILKIAAKSAYPEQFKDVSVNKWVDEYHKKVFHINDEQAQQLKHLLELDWLQEYNF